MSKKIKKKQNRTILIERFEIDGALFAKDIKTGEQGVFLSLKQFTQIQDELARLRHLEISSMGGKKNAPARLIKTAKWQRLALEFAKSIDKTKPGLSQDDLASEIIALWKDANIKCPGHPTMKKFISQCRKDGRLPKRS